ncbi:heavy metal translocating P-type ATPase [Patescibacteria group bacterium]
MQKSKKKLRNKVIILAVLTAILAAGLITFSQIESIPLLIQSISAFLLVTLIVAFGSIGILKTTFKSIRRLKLVSESLNGFAIITLYFYSFTLTLFPSMVEEVSRPFLYITITLIILFLCGFDFYKYVKENKYKKFIHSFDFKHPEFVRILRDDKIHELKLEELKIGDVIEVKSGEMVAADGIIIEGNTLVNESMTEKKVGDQIVEGAKNMENRILIKVTQIDEDSSISQIISILKKRTENLSNTEKKVKKSEKILTLLFLILSLLVLTVWILLNGPVHSSIMIFVSLLLIVSPENFYTIIKRYYRFGINKSSQDGILFKGGRAIEKLSSVNRLILNKTGIITASKPEITNIIPKIGYNEKRLLILVAALESLSPHPFAEAITRFCKEQKIAVTKVQNHRFFEGHGIIGTVDNQEIIIGNLKLMKDSNVQMIDELVSKAEVMSRNIKSPVFIARNRELIGLIGIADSINDHAKEGMHYLNKNFKITLITGDNEIITRAIANELRIKEYIGELKHREKVETVNKFQEEKEIVASIGHGLKDKEILDASDVGIAVGASINISEHKNDVTIIKNDLNKIKNVFENSKLITDFSKKTIFVLSLYHILLIPIAAGAFAPFTGLILHPIEAVGFHILSYFGINYYYSKFKKSFI